MSSAIESLRGNPGTTVTLLPRTPGLLLGPFYPLSPPDDASGSLWRGSAIPQGTKRLVLEGLVHDIRGGAVADAEVELWQADPMGRYAHPSSPERDPVLAGFTGYGRVRSAADGRFRFETLVPGDYTEAESRRAPHLHFQITGRFDRLVTQLFLPGHPLNAKDRWFGALRHPERLVAEVRADAPDGLTLHWIAVLHRG